MAKSYAEKLLDPRWQKKRLEVFQRFNFKCQGCEDQEGDKGDTLHVHHCWYERGKDPWEYPDEAYQCLCRDCHTKAEALRLAIAKVLFTGRPCELDLALDALRKLGGGVSIHHVLDYIGMSPDVIHEGMSEWCDLAVLYGSALGTTPFKTLPIADRFGRAVR